MKMNLDSQYRKAIIYGTLSVGDMNLTRDLVAEEVFFKNGEESVSLNRLFDLPVPCKFTDMTKSWRRVFLGEFDDFSSEDMGEKRRLELLDMFNRGILCDTTEYWSSEALGKKFYIREMTMLTQAENGDVMALIVTKDLTSVRMESELQQQMELEHFAYVDEVTGGANYIKFKDSLRKLDKPGYIVSMDIRSFKIINSVCGISKGDQVIKVIWQTLKVSLGANDLAGHINADHFVIYLDRTEQEIRKIAENVSILLKSISVDLDVPQIEPCFGVAYWDPSNGVEYGYSQASAAKLKIKGHKDENIAFFTETDTDRLVQEKQMEDSFHAALKNRNFEVWYQPKYSPDNSTIVGAEALVRWRTDDGKLVSPGIFIPLFERNGMIRVLDEYVFRTVCEQQKKWLDERVNIVPISINLSRASLYFKSVVSQYKWIAETTGIGTDFVPIEITESAAVSNQDIKTIADDFHKAGFQLHMDDFGTGYSSLALLNTMHFDTLKLDKSLIDFIGEYGGDRLLEHTIALAKDLGMKVTAEGVEHKSQVDFLKTLSCDSIQGYYFSKPLPLVDFEVKMRG